MRQRVRSGTNWWLLAWATHLVEMGRRARPKQPRTSPLPGGTKLTTAGSSFLGHYCRSTRRQRRIRFTRRWALVCGLEWLARPCQLVGFKLARELARWSLGGSGPTSRLEAAAPAKYHHHSRVLCGVGLSSQPYNLFAFGSLLSC